MDFSLEEFLFFFVPACTSPPPSLLVLFLIGGIILIDLGPSGLGLGNELQALGQHDLQRGGLTTAASYGEQTRES